MRHAVARFVKYPMKAFVAPLVLLFVMASYAVAQDNPLVADPKHAHPAPRTSIVRFANSTMASVRDRSPKPIPTTDFCNPKTSNTFWTDSSPRSLPGWKEEGREVWKKHVRQILCTSGDERLRPIYFHCDLGRDRTSLIATLYEICFRGLPAENA